jgi:hypothetical protein
MEMPTTAWFSSFGILPSAAAAVNGKKLVAALSYAQANKLSLVAEEGLYEIDAGAPIQWAFQQSSILAAGPRVQFRHRGTGRFFSFDGNAFNPADDGVKKCVFGGAYQIELMGNPAGGTTDLMYMNKFLDGILCMRGRDASVILRIDNGGSSMNLGSVLSRFDVTVSPDWDESAFAVPSVYGVAASYCYAGQWRLNLEGCGFAPGGQQAAYFDQSNRNTITGSLESNNNGGLFLSSVCRANEVFSMDNEVNGNGPDFTIHGSYNIFRGVAAGTAGHRSVVDGSYNRFENCDLMGMVVGSANGGVKNRFTECSDMSTNGGWTDGGVSTVVRSCEGLADQN